MSETMKGVYRSYVYFNSSTSGIKFPEFITMISIYTPQNISSQFIKKYAVREENERIS